MEVKYLGFEQRQNARSYQFDLIAKGAPSKRLIVIADLSLFHTHVVGIQEGPSLCAGKLVADLKRNFAGPHGLTGEDLRWYVNTRSLSEAKRAEMRKAPGGVHRGRRNDLPEEAPGTET